MLLRLLLRQVVKILLHLLLLLLAVGVFFEGLRDLRVCALLVALALVVLLLVLLMIMMMLLVLVLLYHDLLALGRSELVHDLLLLQVLVVVLDV